MPDTTGSDPSESELRLFLEETCCSLCWSEHARRDGAGDDAAAIDREIYLGAPGAFADIRVRPRGAGPYFIEVKYGYDEPRLLSSFSRKYGAALPGLRGASKVILVLDTRRFPDWPATEKRLRGRLHPGLGLEVWDVDQLVGMIEKAWGVRPAGLSAANLMDVRESIDQVKGAWALGDAGGGDVNALQRSLMWHFGFRRLRQLREAGHADPHSLFPPGLYHDVVVIMADLASFSSYVRDTPDEQVVRDCLTSFYSKSRWQVLNSGGMLYQFLGDAALALFGVPDRPPGYVDAAFQCARSLVQVGDSVSDSWQRRIDRVQQCGGVHVGMAIGDLQIMPLRPYSRTVMGAVGDAINMAARLENEAGPGEVVVSNRYYQRLGPSSQSMFEELTVVEAKNVGRLRAWKSRCGVSSAGPACPPAGGCPDPPPGPAAQ